MVPFLIASHILNSRNRFKHVAMGVNHGSVYQPVLITLGWGGLASIPSWKVRFVLQFASKLETDCFYLLLVHLYILSAVRDQWLVCSCTSFSGTPLLKRVVAVVTRKEWFDFLLVEPAASAISLTILVHTFYPSFAFPNHSMWVAKGTTDNGCIYKWSSRKASTGNFVRYRSKRYMWQFSPLVA